MTSNNSLEPLGCLEDLNNWMAKNVLDLNENKTEILLFGLADTSGRLLSSLSP